jgi:hypothetical protein
MEILHAEMKKATGAEMVQDLHEDYPELFYSKKLRERVLAVMQQSG